MKKNLTLEDNGYELDPRRFLVREALSRHFEVAVWARVKNDNVDLENVVGGPAMFTLAMDRRHRSWFGLARHAESSRSTKRFVRSKPRPWTRHEI